MVLLHIFKNSRCGMNSVQQVAYRHPLRDKIVRVATENGLGDSCYSEMLDYTINLFESQGLGSDYYGYHNIDHELEVTYVTLLAASQDMANGYITEEDLKYLYVSALFHDFDPQKSVDKPHEDSVICFLSLERNLRRLLSLAGLDIEIVKVLILRTTYPWSGSLRDDAEAKMKECFMASETTRNNIPRQEEIAQLGWFLSVVDRVGGYALGGFSKGMEMAKMNAHALAWHPSLIVARAVSYFEYLLHDDSTMLRRVMSSLPRDMRKNFMENVQSFLALRQQEIRIQAEHLYDNLHLVPVIESMETRRDPAFIKELFEIFCQLPKPLQFARDRFEESIRNPETILNTLRRQGPGGKIVGYAKGGSLEEYVLRPEIKDENYGLGNTVFLEPFPLKMGYWGLRGGSEMRHLFTMQALSKKYAYLTGFALRDVVRQRAQGYENAEFVTLFDPERWDYYRIKI